MSSTKRSDPVQTASERLASLLSRLPPGPVAVAFSGGADSLALALLAGQLRQRRVELYTVEHNLRGPEAAAEAYSHLTALSRALSMPLRRAEIPPGRIAAGEAGVEATARALRYRALAALAEGHGGVAVLTAHHRDDQVETILLGLLRGAAETALGGICESRPLALPGGGRVALLRPLLEVGRRDLEGVVAASGLEPLADESNRDERYERNRLRLRVIPLLRDAFAGGEAALLAEGRRLRRLGEDIRRRSRRIAVRRVGEVLSVDAAEFFCSPPGVRGALMEEQSRRANRPFPGRSMRFLEPLLADPVRSEWFDRRRSEEILESGGHRFTLHRGRLLWQYDIVPLRDFRYLHEVDGSPFELHWSRGWWPTDYRGRERRQSVVSLPRELLRPPVIVRSRRSGDRLRIRGASRPLHSLYDRLALPQVVRENIPIIEDRNGILALPADLFGAPRLLREGVTEGDGALAIRFFAHGDFV